MCAGGCPVGAGGPETGGPEAVASVTVHDRSVNARKPVRMCVRCDRFTTAPVLVSEVHSGSGPGFNVYACTKCAPLFPDFPNALDLLQAGRHSRAEDGNEQ